MRRINYPLSLIALKTYPIMKGNWKYKSNYLYFKIKIIRRNYVKN